MFKWGPLRGIKWVPNRSDQSPSNDATVHTSFQIIPFPSIFWAKSFHAPLLHLAHLLQVFGPSLSFWRKSCMERRGSAASMDGSSLSKAKSTTQRGRKVWVFMGFETFCNTSWIFLWNLLVQEVFRFSLQWAAKLHSGVASWYLHPATVLVSTFALRS